MTYLLRGKINGLAFEAGGFENKKALIFCPGFPAIPKNQILIKEMISRGFLTIYPRYRGTWESDGVFLKEDLIDDIRIIINMLKSGNFISLWDDSQINFSVDQISIFGHSFGGSIALVAGAKIKNIKNIVASAPIIDFRKHNEKGDEQDLSNLKEFIKKAYGCCYRFDDNNFDNLIKGNVDINPIDFIDTLKYKDILLLHGNKDTTISIEKTEFLSKKLNSTRFIKHNAGHKLIEIFKEAGGAIFNFLEQD